MMDLPFCKCGCGIKVTNKSNKYIKGHYFKGRLKGPYSKVHKEKIKEGVLKAYKNPEVKQKQFLNTPKGKNHPVYGTEGYWKNKHHTEESKLKSSKSQSGKNHHFYKKEHKKTTREKISKTCKKWWNSSNGLKQRKIQSIKMNSGQAAYCNFFIKNPSKPQVELFNKVQKIFSTAVLNYPFFNYSLDIAIPEKRLVIEYDGSYWHKDKIYDEKRRRYLKNYKWKYINYVDYIPSTNELKTDIYNLLDQNK